MVVVSLLTPGSSGRAGTWTALDWLWGDLIVRLQLTELLRQYNEMLLELRCC
jgi:hypothetical protein